MKDLADPVVIKLAVLAVGGQGGGVLAGWIETVARASGYAVQATSVAGVAQRTGATVYYLEMCPTTPRQPVFGLMPAAGDVDVMIASEMMEVGRAIIRGFVTPDRTVLIGSSHRALAVSEKMVPGDGIASSTEVLAAAEIAARRVIVADFDAIAVAAGSVISASLLGALAASQTLPFPRAAYEAAIKAAGKGTERSLAAFAAGFAAATDAAPLVAPSKPANPHPQGPAHLRAAFALLSDRADRLPAQVADLARPGLRKVVDFQDVAYGEDYLTRLEHLLRLDDPAKGHIFTREAAKYLANAMAYDDVIRVADLKTRTMRAQRIRTEMSATPENLLHITEYVHPRAEEIAGMLPARLGAWLSARPKTMHFIDRWFCQGRHLRSDRLWSYAMFYAIAGLSRWRRGTLRHAEERAHLDRWLGLARHYLPLNYDLAVEILRCRRLIKGYSDTHSRGQSKFDRVIATLPLIATRPDAADWIRRLREAALQDEEGKALDGALRTIASFT